MCVCCGCYVLSGRYLCDGLIIRREKSCRLWKKCDCEASKMRRPWPTRAVEPWGRRKGEQNGQNVSVCD